MFLNFDLSLILGKPSGKADYPLPTSSVRQLTDTFSKGEGKRISPFLGTLMSEN